MSESQTEHTSIVKSHVTVPYVWGKGWAMPGGRFTDLRSFAEALAVKLNAMATGAIPGCPRIAGKRQEQIDDEIRVERFNAIRGSK